MPTGIGVAIGLTGTAATVAGVAVIAGTTIAIGSTVMANNATKAAVRQQQVASRLQATRQRRSAIRQNILGRARARASAEAAGTAQTSGLAGGLGASQSQLYSGLGFGSQLTNINANISYLQGKASTYEMYAGLGQQVASFGASAQGGQIINKYV